MRSKASSSRLTHPHARYDKQGRLSCALCALPVKHDALWTAHLQSKSHRERARAAEQEQEGESKKRARGEDGAAPAPKRRRDDGQDEDDGEEQLGEVDGLPADFFSDKSKAPAAGNVTTAPAGTSASAAADTATGEPDLDAELAAFEASLDVPDDGGAAATGAGGAPVLPSAYALGPGATISGAAVEYEHGAPKIYDEEEEAALAANGQGYEDGEEEEQETEEEKRERLEREEREELLARMLEEEREQAEADDKVQVSQMQIDYTHHAFLRWLTCAILAVDLTGSQEATRTHQGGPQDQAAMSSHGASSRSYLAISVNGQAAREGVPGRSGVRRSLWRATRPDVRPSLAAQIAAPIIGKRRRMPVMHLRDIFMLSCNVSSEAISDRLCPCLVESTSHHPPWSREMAAVRRASLPSLSRSLQLAQRRSASSASSSAAASSSSSSMAERLRADETYAKVMPSLLPPLQLYRRLLRVHRKALPAEMRVMGDEYVKVRSLAAQTLPIITRTGLSLPRHTVQAEFRRTRSTENPIYIVGFLGEWKKYLDQLEADLDAQLDGGNAAAADARAKAADKSVQGRKLDPEILEKVRARALSRLAPQPRSLLLSSSLVFVR